MMIADNRKQKKVAIWLLKGVGMIIVQVLLGGVTRLTESGLSITEWQPVKGAIPPLTEAGWQAEFDKYKHLGQFQFLHADFTLSDFKFIFFWEWFHRLWARMMGVVFAVGFVFFLVRGYFDKKMIVPFIILFLLGALQGLIGWIMVASGINETSLYVNHIKLSFHFVAALVLLCYTLWFALKLLVPDQDRVKNSKMFMATVFVLIILLIQLFYGAFMAGLKAAPYAPTWPDINGSFAPDTLQNESWISQPFNVQFIHRMMAYLLTIAVLIWTFMSNNAQLKISTLYRKIKYIPIILIGLQVLLGIFTVLKAPVMGAQRFGIYEFLAEAHQLVALFFLVVMIIALYLFKPQKA